MIRRMELMEIKVFLAGVVLEILSATSITSMATFNAKMASSRSFGRWGIASMVETRCGCERVVRRASCEKESEPK